MSSWNWEVILALDYLTFHHGAIGWYITGRVGMRDGSTAPV
jgi:hypothetical protein